MELLDRPEVRIIGYRRHRHGGGIDHAINHGRQQYLLRIEVVVEGALGRAEFDQDLLHAQLLVALCLDQALGDVDECVPPKSVGCRIERARHWSSQ